jgi:hypothetical protein
MDGLEERKESKKRKRLENERMFVKQGLRRIEIAQITKVS